MTNGDPMIRGEDSHPPAIKLCGLRDVADARAAVLAGADLIGIILVPGTRRYVSPPVAAEMARVVRRMSVDNERGAPEIVGVVGRVTPAEAVGLVSSIGLDSMQLVGDESPCVAIADAVRQAMGEAFPLIRTIGVPAETELDPERDPYFARIAALAETWEARGARVMFDAQVDGQLGGTGRRLSSTSIRPLLETGRRGLAGGLTPENVAEVILHLRPAMVDVSSGIESADGCKDPERMRAFVTSARTAHGERSGRRLRHPDLTTLNQSRRLSQFSRSAMTAQIPIRHSDALSGFRLDLHPLSNDGQFGPWGGSWIPEVLVPAVTRIADAWSEARNDPAFLDEYLHLCRTFIGRPTPLQEAPRLSALAGGARIVLKREDLAHTGAHKINNAIGQALLAKRLGVTRVIAETGAGQHGVATATACALLGLECVVHMGARDIERQHPNVVRMELLGARVHAVEEGTRTLADAVSSAVREWITHPDDTYYLIGSAVGMHPFPTMVRELQSVIGYEARRQSRELLNRLPNAVVACVGGGSNAIGTFAPFLHDEKVELHGAEAAGEGLETVRHAASINGGRDGVLHGARTMLLQDDDGQVLPTHSISAGLDYPGVGPEHAWLASSGRATYHPVTDSEAMEALSALCRTEGIIPAVESAHAIALGLRLAAERSSDDVVLVTISGRGDKDLSTIIAHREGEERSA